AHPGAARGGARSDRLWRRLRGHLHGPVAGGGQRRGRPRRRECGGRAQRDLPRRHPPRRPPARRTGARLMRVITVPGHLDHRSVDQLAAQLGTWPPEERILVDAHAAEWASPSGFTALLTLAQAIAEAGGPAPRLTLPAADTVTSYWARTGFIAHA